MAIKLYMVYDSEKDNERIGSFTPEDAHKLLGIKKNQVSVYASTGNRYKSRYLFVAEPVESDEYDLYDDWDATVKKIKDMAGGGKRGNKDHKKTLA